MNKIKDERVKSIKYIIPIVVAFIGILILKHFSSISSFIVENITTINDLLAPFFIGFIIAYILNQPIKYIENKYKIKRGISIGLLQINEFITKVLVPLSTTTANVLSELVINLMSVIVSYTVNIFLGIVISVYLLLSKEKYLEVVNILGKKIFNKHYLKVKEFINILDKNIGVYIVAKATDSTIYGIICTAILYLLNAKYALFLGIVAGVTNMIPFFGPIIGTIVAVIINLFFSFDPCEPSDAIILLKKSCALLAIVKCITIHLLWSRVDRNQRMQSPYVLQSPPYLWTQQW